MTMSVFFFNAERREEVILERIQVRADSVDFSAIIKHDPFYVKTSVSFSEKAIQSFCDNLAELKEFKIYL